MALDEAGRWRNDAMGDIGDTCGGIALLLRDLQRGLEHRRSYTGAPSS